jgi:hypothetical protein
VLVGTQLPPVITTLSSATATLFAAMQIVYAIPMAYLPERAAASSPALINRFGLTGGFFSPILMGSVQVSRPAGV